MYVCPASMWWSKDNFSRVASHLPAVETRSPLFSQPCCILHDSWPVGYQLILLTLPPISLQKCWVAVACHHIWPFRSVLGVRTPMVRLAWQVLSPSDPSPWSWVMSLTNTVSSHLDSNWRATQCWLHLEHSRHSTKVYSNSELVRRLNVKYKWKTGWDWSPVTFDLLNGPQMFIGNFRPDHSISHRVPRSFILPYTWHWWKGIWESFGSRTQAVPFFNI